MIVLISLILPLTMGFAENVETKTLAKSSKVYTIEQIGLLKAGKVNTEIYIARAHDNYFKIARRYGMSSRYLMNINNVKSPYLIVKTPVVIQRFIEPASSQTGLIINIPEKKLYHFSNGKLLKTYGVAVGQPTWQTPMGNFSILYKTKAPAWYIPVSIQKEMARNGKVVQTVVPAGPGNPLGNWWMAIANGIGIHSTNAPSSIGYSVTHGCIRMKPRSAEELFKKVKVKTPVKVIYQPVKVGVDNNNDVYLEAYSDIYSRNINYTNAVTMLLKQSNIDSNINWNSVTRVIRARQGIPVLISMAVKPLITPTEIPSLKPTVKPSTEPSAKPSGLVPTSSPSVIQPTGSPTEKAIDIIPSVRPRPKATPTATPSIVITPTVNPTPEAPLPTPTNRENMVNTSHPG